MKSLKNIKSFFNFFCSNNKELIKCNVFYSIQKPITWDGQIVSICYSLIGIPLFFICIARMSQLFGRIFRSLYTRVRLILIYFFCEKLCLRKCKQKRQSDSKFEVKDLEQESISSNDSIDDIFFNQSSKFAVLRAPVKKMTIPMVIVLFILVLYFYIGTLVLHRLEGWNSTETIYFTFISISSIGKLLLGFCEVPNYIEEIF